MTQEQFCYWLQGFIELSQAENYHPTIKQWAMIQEHLKSVFTCTPKTKDSAPIVFDIDSMEKDLADISKRQTFIC